MSTSKGAEGLDVLHGENILLGDAPAEFANYVISLLSDKVLYQRLANNGKETVQKHYDWGGMSYKYEVLVESALK
ncbi:MAG: glycosyltransferase family 4 protein [Anaerolineae bacterium]|nr:glycosyltransferase family 4 protein [Anaerolineae bacterium]